MSSARTREMSVRASVRIQRDVKIKELIKEVRDSERIDERRPPLAHRPSATQPILRHLKQISNILLKYFDYYNKFEFVFFFSQK